MFKWIRPALFSRAQSPDSYFRRMFAMTDFRLPLEAWQATGSVMTNILVASLAINILSLAFPLTLLQIYDRIIPNVAINTLVLLVIGVSIALLLEVALRVARSYVGAWADSKFEHLIGCRAFKHLIQSPLYEYIREGSGIHLKRINFLSQMRDFYAGQALVSLADLPFVFVLLALVILIANWLVLIPLGVLVTFIFVTLIHAKNLDDVLQQRQTQDDRRSNFLIETLTNIHTVKSVTMEAQMLRRYERLQRTSSVHDYDLSMLNSVSGVNTLMLSQIVIILVVAFGSIMVIHGNLTIGGLAACTLLSGRSLQPVTNLVSVWTRLQTIKIARDELQKVLELPFESRENAPQLMKVHGDIQFQNVSFRYKDEGPDIIHDFNLHIPAKGSISITGAGLSGKSTLLWLLLGMLRPTHGKILIDDQDVDKFQVQSVRRQIAYMPQQGMLFKGTIMENLTMFRKGDYYQRALNAAKLVGLNTIIEHLPLGYDTPVADQTMESLPRGLRQRIAIARALLLEPPIVVFDEANTAIDMQGDSIIKALLEKMVGRVTLILISHRPSIINVAKTHYLLENGTLRLAE